MKGRNVDMNIANESISAKEIDDISAKVLKSAKDLQGIARDNYQSSD